MLGTLRLLLAVMVVFSHLSGVISHLGVYAVFGFYVLSGYLMTAVLNGTYRFNARSFWTNRALRLLPIYYMVGTATIVVLFLFPNEAATFKDSWAASLTSWDYLANALLVPLPFVPSIRLVPPSWSVAVEIINYGILFLIGARSVRLAIILFASSSAYHVFAVVTGLDWASRYYPWYAAILPFSVGAMCYFFLSSGHRIKARYAIPLTGTWVGVIVVSWVNATWHHFGASFYVSMFLVAALVITLAPMRGRLSVVDKRLGDLAYPLFLVHWLCGFLVSLAVPVGPRSWVLFITGLGVSLVISAAIAWISDRAIEPIRDRVRDGTALRAISRKAVPAE